MAEPLPNGLRIESAPDHVTIEFGGARWEGTAAQAEQVFTGLHYAIARARPGTAIASMFFDGALWGGKFFEEDREAAIRHMRILLARLSDHLDTLPAAHGDEG
jgi:hypothetical protein